MAQLICGIDPGLGLTGYAIVRTSNSPNRTANFSAACIGAEIVDAGVCRFSRTDRLPNRLAALHADIAAILDEHHPNLVAVEQLYSHYNHPRTAILMGHARGVILLAAATASIEVKSYSATRIKRYLTGNGRASKLQMQRAVQTTLGLSAMPDPPDVADAIAIALCCVHEVRSMKLEARTARNPDTSAGPHFHSSNFSLRSSRPTGAL